MMNIFRQQELLDKLANILHTDAPAGYDSVSCRYKYEPDYETITSQFWYVVDGQHQNAALSTGLASENLGYTQELRELMKEHTGGEWDAFTLTLDADGKAHCDFEYPDAQ